jgi:hypothetical protein
MIDELMLNLVLPTELKERIMAYLIRDESMDALEIRKRGLQAQFDRVQELYITGDIGRGRYDQEKAATTSR